MDGVDELKRILALPDDDDGDPPADGQPLSATAADTDAEEGDEDEGPLSAADLVAEAVRQDREAQGLEPDEAGAEASDEADEPEEDDLTQLRAQAARAQQWDAWAEHQARQQAEQQLVSGYERAREQTIAHYEAEEQRIIENLRRDAYNAADPDAYWNQHYRPVVSGIRAQRDAWLGQIDGVYRARRDEQFHQNNKPLFAKHLIAHFNLPDDERVHAELLRVSDVRRMPERAEELARMRDQFVEMHRMASQAEREVKATRFVAEQAVHSGATGTPRRRKAVSYTGSASELREILALRD